MKLIGSKMEQEFRAALINSHESLFRDKSKQRILNVLKSSFPEMKTAYFLEHTPEQGEDLYLLLVDAAFVISIELDRYDLSIEPIVQISPLKQYKQKLRKINQIKLAVAMDLSHKDLM